MTTFTIGSGCVIAANFMIRVCQNRRRSNQRNAEDQHKMMPMIPPAQPPAPIIIQAPAPATLAHARAAALVETADPDRQQAAALTPAVRFPFLLPKGDGSLSS